MGRGEALIETADLPESYEAVRNCSRRGEVSPIDNTHMLSVPPVTVYGTTLRLVG